MVTTALISYKGTSICWSPEASCKTTAKTQRRQGGRRGEERWREERRDGVRREDRKWRDARKKKLLEGDRREEQLRGSG